MNAPMQSPAQLAESIHANSTPAELAAAIAPHWRGVIENVEIAEDMLGWAVRVTVQFRDKRRRGVTWAECGASRGEAIQRAVNGASAWADIHDSAA